MKFLRGASDFFLGRVCCSVLTSTGLLGQFSPVLIDGVNCGQLIFVGYLIMSIYKL